jgi:hypothetical protein
LRIASLSSREFVGMVADAPDQKISLNMFHTRMLNDTHKWKAEPAAFK